MGDVAMRVNGEEELLVTEVICERAESREPSELCTQKAGSVKRWVVCGSNGEQQFGDYKVHSQRHERGNVVNQEMTQLVEPLRYTLLLPLVQPLVLKRNQGLILDLWRGMVQTRSGRECCV